MTDVSTRKKLTPRRGLGQAIVKKRLAAERAIEQQAEARRDRERQAAREELERLKRAATDRQRNGQKRWAQSLLRSVVNNQTALMRVWKYNQTVKATVSTVPTVQAWTDWREVVITWPETKVPGQFSTSEVRNTVAQMKGVFQHELGHLRFTTPYKRILPHIAAPTSRHQLCWNLLEDQRMESLVVEAVPRIANYFGPMLAEVVLGQGATETWLMLAGRTYLPVRVRRESFMLFDAFCDEQGVDDGAEKWLDIVNEYRAATTEQELADAVCKALAFIDEVRATIPKTVDDHTSATEGDGADPEELGRPGSSILDLFDDRTKPSKNSKTKQGSGSSSEDSPTPSAPTGEGDSEAGDDEDAQGGGQGEDDDDEAEGEGAGGQGEGDDDGEGEDGEGDGGAQTDSDASDGEESAPGQSFGESDPHFTEESLRDAFTDALAGFQQELANDGSIREILTDAQEAFASEGLPDYDGPEQPMSPELVERATRTAIGVEQALNTFLTESAPRWMARQERGVIDPLHYRTKQNGALDYRRYLHGDGNSGLDVHVSMLCDVSGSMGSSYGQSEPAIVALSEALYATALACNQMGIGSTFTLWSSGQQNYRVWRDNNPTPSLWPCMGGTDPLVALDDLDTHNPEDARDHLVIIFTDGAWSRNFPSIRQWDKPNRRFILVRYGNYEGEVQKDMGAHSHVQINHVNQLVEQLTNGLKDVLAGGD
jgi:hypothetical protein